MQQDIIIKQKCEKVLKQGLKQSKKSKKNWKTKYDSINNIISMIEINSNWLYLIILVNNWLIIN